MVKGYKNIVLGLILATFHINLGTLPIIPSFIAWIIVAMGVELIEEAEGQLSFNRSKKACAALIILTLLDLIKTNIDISLGNPYMLSILVALIELFFVYYFFRGVTQMFEAKGKIEYACENERILRRYTVFQIIGILILGVFWLNYSNTQGELIAIFMLALRIYIIYHVNKIGKLYDAEGI